MDAALLDQLETEHRQVEELFSKLERAESDDEQRPLVEELVAALTRHMKIEETEVYPEVAKIDAEMEEEAENEHQLGRDGLATLDSMVGQPGFGAAVAMLKAGIGHHVEEEESEVFPALREALGYPAGDASKRRAVQAGASGGNRRPLDDDEGPTRRRRPASLTARRSAATAQTDSVCMAAPTSVGAATRVGASDLWSGGVERACERSSLILSEASGDLHGSRKLGGLHRGG